MLLIELYKYIKSKVICDIPVGRHLQIIKSRNKLQENQLILLANSGST